jgi:hypothetical protein
MQRSSALAPALFTALAALAVLSGPLLFSQEGLGKKAEKIKIEWQHQETKNYSFDSEKVVPSSTVKTVGLELEDILEQYVGLFREKPSARLTVKFLDSLNTYEQEGGDPSHPGHYNPSSRCLVVRQMPFTDLIPTVYHEAFHQYLATYVGPGTSIPTWFNEGTASYFEQMQREKGTKKLNPRLIEKRKFRMVKDAFLTRAEIPLEKLIDASYEEFHAKDKESLYYTQSFAMIYFLIQTAGGKAVAGYMQELKKTKDVEAANAKLFGPARKNLKKVEKAFKDYTLAMKLDASGR